MPHKMVFISHAVRFPQRQDVLSIRGILQTLRTNLRRQTEVVVCPMAPYLLHAQIVQTQELLAEYRVKYASQLHRGKGVAPHELHLYGDELSEVMLAEIEAAHKLGIPVLNQSPALVESLLKVSHVAVAA